MIYRRRRKSDVWHFVKACRWWPASNYNVHPYWSKIKPQSGELCDECLAKAKAKRA